MTFLCRWLFQPLDTRLDAARAGLDHESKEGAYAGNAAQRSTTVVYFRDFAHHEDLWVIDCPLRRVNRRPPKELQKVVCPAQRRAQRAVGDVHKRGLVVRVLSLELEKGASWQGGGGVRNGSRRVLRR